ncbi:flagellar basal-body rod modification protein FlgD [Polymorphobacter multimanifer]|uniref:Basal-body rod modification protein FlgD n=1 Tax=Polymorphobacter multimanifer TaxID=1070431 RepID=A0A841L319_9SPHN|nr:flagellar hook capping FlgD N-terminal domain-containing protein [Polymorphobacter multimanifer]MBB6226696.1 flagellar basal-body rod modification protein FlgD [Polymorphobacter multimanifer]
MSVIPSGIRPVQTGPEIVPRGPKTLGQADFLALMTAQLKNQDPTKPVDNTEYVAQMAQFSMVAGVSESNTTLSRIAASLDTLLARTPIPQE